MTEEPNNQTALPASHHNDVATRIGPNMYMRWGKISFRICVDGKRKWLSTGTDDPATARKIYKTWQEEQVLRAHGVEPRSHALQRQKLTANDVIDNYVKDGLPDRKLNQKAPTTIATETRHLPKLKMFFGSKIAMSIGRKDCDDYRRWRATGGYTWIQRGKERKSIAHDKVIDLELQTLGNAFALAYRQEILRTNPLTGRPRYHSAKNTRHCREVAPTSQELVKIEQSLRQHGFETTADCVMFLAFSGLRINEALPLKWSAVDWEQGIIHVKREKQGDRSWASRNDWVAIEVDMQDLLKKMLLRRGDCEFLFPSSNDPRTPIPYQTVYWIIIRTVRLLKMHRVTPHGLRSYFVTQCRESGLLDAEIAELIGDKSGPRIIAETYGDVRPEHLRNRIKRVRLLMHTRDGAAPAAANVA